MEQKRQREQQDFLQIKGRGFFSAAKQMCLNNDYLMNLPMVRKPESCPKLTQLFHPEVYIVTLLLYSEHKKVFCARLKQQTFLGLDRTILFPRSVSHLWKAEEL